MTTSSLAGLSLFPSWTKDGRLCFRYDGDDYRGFMMVDHPLDVPEQPLPAVAEPLPHRRTWEDVFQTAARPGHRVNVVMWTGSAAGSPAAPRCRSRRAGSGRSVLEREAHLRVAIRAGLHRCAEEERVDAVGWWPWL